MGRNVKKKKRARRHGCLGALIALALVVVLIVGGLYVAARLKPVVIVPADNASELDVNEELSDEWVNIMLLGADAGAYARSDTMIIASVQCSSGKVKLTSLMRDTYVPIDGYGSNKINTATHFGGIDLALKTVNQCFDMNISKYAMVDFSAFAYIVEAIGGVDVPVSEAEMRSMNQLMQDMRVLYPEIELPKEDLTVFGDSVHLDGMQALAFARIRKLDSDYNRTNRQRTLLMAIMKKAASPSVFSGAMDIYAAIRDHVKTNLATDEVLQLAAKVLSRGVDFEELRIPVEGTYSAQRINGQDCLVPDIAANAARLHEFVYGG